MDGGSTEAGDTAPAASPDGRSRRRLGVRLVGVAAAGLIGFLLVTSALSAKGGYDLRPERQSDLTDLVRQRAADTRQLQTQEQQLDAHVRQLAGTAGGSATKRLQGRGDELASQDGLTPVAGPGVTVTLDDAPRSVGNANADADALVVHQQDIQAVVNALWAGGAEAVAVQGQRLITTSSVRCVGNSVILDGVPYPPPYQITAVGPPGAMLDALARSPAVKIYLEYVARYHLGYTAVSSDRLELAGYQGSVDLQHAQPSTPTTASGSDR